MEPQKQAETKKPRQLVAADWKYLAEGGAHVIFEYVGNEFEYMGKILRLDKEKPASSRAKTEVEEVMETLFETSYLEQLMTEEVFQKVTAYSQLLEIDDVFEIADKQTFLEQLLKINESQRPEKRRDQGLALVGQSSLLFNYSYEPNRDELPSDALTATIEMKPKSHLPDRYTEEQVQEAHEVVLKTLEKPVEITHKEVFVLHFHNENQDIEHRFTKFYKVQLKKVQEKEYSSPSKYNPVYFFSNDPKKIDVALTNLLETPQNNLRLKLNGKKLDLTKSIMDNLDSYLPIKHEGESNAVSVRIIRQILMKEKAVNAICAFQDLFDYNVKAVDKLTSELVAIWKELSKQGESIVTKIRMKGHEALKRLAQQIDTKQVAPVDVMMKKLADPELNLEEKFMMLWELIIRFLLSIAFRDCSILVNLVAIKSTETQALPRILGEYKSIEDPEAKLVVFYKVGIIDYQIKNYHKAVTYTKLDKELLYMYMNHVLTSPK